MNISIIVENRNKTIKLIKHASNGYLNWERFRNRILYTLNSYKSQDNLTNLLQLSVLSFFRI